MHPGIDTDMKDQQLHQLQCLNREFEAVAVTRNNVPKKWHTPHASNGLSLMVSIFSIIRSLVKSMVQWCNGATSSNQQRGVAADSGAKAATIGFRRSSLAS